MREKYARPFVLMRGLLSIQAINQKLTSRS